MDIGSWVHLSVDDVIDSFKWICENKPASAFDAPLLSTLKNWHERYKLPCDLYIFEEDGEFNISMLGNEYWKELGRESSWLKFCWHRRKRGELTDDLKTEKASFLNVSNLIFSKMSIKSQADIVRLHRWEAGQELVSFLQQQGIKTMLTADRNIASYGLDAESMEELEQRGSCVREGMRYVPTDIRLDCLSDGTSVESLLGKTEEIASKYWNRKLEIFFHEWKFGEIKEKVEKYWKCFENIQMDIYIDSSVLIGNEMYFYSRNGFPCMFHKNLEDDDIDVFAVLKRAGLFASMHYYCGKIWMIPRWDGDYVVVIDIESKHQIYMELPDRFKEKGGFRKGVQSGKYLWAVSVRERAFLRIDMESCNADVIDISTLAELSFDSKRNRNFMCIQSDNGKLYAFKDACSRNLVLDEENMEVAICPVQTKGDYAAASEGKVYVSPTQERGTVRIYNSTDGRLLQEIDIPQKVRSDYGNYAFWCYSTQRRIYMLPHEANGILEVEKDGYRLRVIYPELAGYRTYRPLKKFAGYEVHSSADIDVIMPHFGNAYLVVDKKTGEIKRECYTKIPFSLVDKRGWKFNQRIVSDNEENDLRQWLEFVKTDGGIDIKRL